MDLSNLEWKEFIIGEVFDVVNSKAYHKNELSIVVDNEIPYITRGMFDNGLDSFVEEKDDFIKNPKNSIVFGAESALFFYEPFEYITGNKMYYISHERFNKYICLFLVGILNNAISNSAFGFGYGLTGSRLKNVRILLPVDGEGKPNFKFMQDYVINLEKDKLKKSKEHIFKCLNDLEYKEIEQLNEKSWNEFNISDVFENLQRGKRLTKKEFLDGDIPYVSSTANNNGLDAFIGNTEDVRIFSNCLTLANSGSVGSTFYHPYSFVASDHVTHLKNEKFNKYIYLFLASIIKRLDEKYNFNREINDERLRREMIILPVTDEGKPDYDYMEQYMINLEINLLEKYVDYIKE